ncbi:hypothetical protein GH733_000128 [Mirounga leonina]|nr:hypothetical protein GH733_000128 [Mirounga leonina]
MSTWGQTALDFSSRSYALSVEDVVQQVDQRSPGSPPSYEEAIRCQALDLSAHGGQTVGSMRARMLRRDTQLPPLLPFHHGGNSKDICSPLLF